MNRKTTLVLLSTILLLLTGCATMNEDECRSADWYSVGFEDGSYGRPINYIGNHREACAEYGISPRADRYQDGWKKGIRRYCTPRNGYQAGVRGRSHGAQCPSDLARDFNAAYQYGKRIYYLNRELSDIDHEMRSRQTELEQVQKELAQIERQLMGETHRDREQDRLHARLRQLYRLEAELEAQLARLKRKDKRPGPAPDNDREDKDRDRGRDRNQDRDRDDNWDKDHDRGDKRDKKDERNKEDKGRDREDKRDNGKDRKGFTASHGQRNDKDRKKLEKELAAIRREIRSLEKQLDRYEQRQSNWKLIQRSRQLTLREGQLMAQLELLQRERLDLEQEISWLKRRAPY